MKTLALFIAVLASAAFSFAGDAPAGADMAKAAVKCDRPCCKDANLSCQDCKTCCPDKSKCEKPCCQDAKAACAANAECTDKAACEVKCDKPCCKEANLSCQDCKTCCATSAKCEKPCDNDANACSVDEAKRPAEATGTQVEAKEAPKQ